MIQSVKPFLKLAIVSVSLATTSLGFANPQASLPVMQNQNDFSKVTLITQIKSSTNKSYVVLEGYIVGHVVNKNKDDFLFKDESGEIPIQIDNHVWRNQNITPNMKVRIIGEIEVNDSNDSIDIEAKYLDLVKN